MSDMRIQFSEKRIAEFCRKWNVEELSLFGSVLRDDFGPKSDVDVLVEFEPGCTPGLALIRMQDELAEIFGVREVDLVIKRALNRRIRKHVLAEAEVRYVREG